MQERRAFVYDASTIVTIIGGCLSGPRLAPRRLFQVGMRDSSWDVAVSVDTTWDVAVAVNTRHQAKVFVTSLMPQHPLEAAVNSRACLAGPILAIDSLSCNPSGRN